MPETEAVRPPTAASMRLDGGHPALELVNTIYGQVGGPVEHDVLATPEDLVVLARRLGLADADTPAGETALAEARALRDSLDGLLRARVADTPPPAGALDGLEAAARAAVDGAKLSTQDGAVTWSWPSGNAHSPVHRLAHAALALLADGEELTRLHQCDGCCWLFLDHSRGSGRRWCSMADCGTEAKKRRYVERRRERRSLSVD